MNHDTAKTVLMQPSLKITISSNNQVRTQDNNSQNLIREIPPLFSSLHLQQLQNFGYAENFLHIPPFQQINAANDQRNRLANADLLREIQSSERKSVIDDIIKNQKDYDVHGLLNFDCKNLFLCNIL